AADRAEAEDRRRREDRDESILDRGKALIQLPGDRPAAQCRSGAFRKGLQRHEDDAGIRAVGEPIDRETGKGDRTLDTRLPARDVAHAADDVLAAIEGGAV